jgi:hypothetical protein
MLTSWSPRRRDADAPDTGRITGMPTLQECIDSGLEVEEIEAIAQHERIPEIVAAELGNYLLATSDGRRRIRRMIADNLSHARQAAD